MSIDPQSLEVGKCYRTERGEVRLVTQIEGEHVTFAPRGPRFYLDWHETASRQTLLRDWFAEDAVEEVPYSWEPRPNSALA